MHFYNTFSVVLSIFIGLSFALYEDQVGKFEWRQLYVGNPKFTAIDAISPIKKVILGTENNVLAALSLKSGQILWRHLLATDGENSIKGLYIDDEVVVVTGSIHPIVRGFELETGHLLWEWVCHDCPKYCLQPENDKIVFLDVSSSNSEVKTFELRTGALLAQKIYDIKNIQPSICESAGSHVACFNIDARVLTVLSIDNNGDLRPRQLSLAGHDIKSADLVLKTVGAQEPAISISDGEKQIIISLKPDLTVINNHFSPSAAVSSAVYGKDTILISTEIKQQAAYVTAVTTSGKKISDLEGNIPLPSATSHAATAVAACLSRRGDVISCKVLVVTADHAAAMLHLPDNVQWLREEALASIQTVEMVQLPVPDALAVENEFGRQTVGFFDLLCRRLVGQWRQLSNYIGNLMGENHDAAKYDTTLLRDEFGLRKMIVVVTRPGKVFGIDSVTGNIIWRLVTGMTSPFSLHLVRSALHAPCQMVLLGRPPQGGSQLVTFDPIAGAIKASRSLPAVKQVLLLTQTDANNVRPLLLLDSHDKLHIHPADSSVDVDAAPTYFYTVDKLSGKIKGYRVQGSPSGPKVVQLWMLNLGRDDAQIISVIGKRDSERVHSQGRVLGDRSVLYKYVNPNLVAVLTMGNHPSHKGVLNVYLIDAVSGLIVWSTCHKRAREPIHAVHAENWLVYSWVSDKHRRTELATVELFEGATQANATAFSSLAAPPMLPIAEKQAYILPSTIRSLTDTVTEKGITTKHIIVALSSGGVLELPWAYLDPRRTVAVTQEMREEGIVPYIPELPIPSEAILNHNQTVLNVRGQHTSPSGLESTSLLLVYGVDLYFTRVAPSKTFDLLKEDFDYALISAVLGGLTLACIITRNLSSRKALRQAWK